MSSSYGLDDPTYEVLEWVNRTHEMSYTLERRFAGGADSGAYLITAPDGTPAVLKWSPDTAWARQVLRAAHAVESVRRHGYPTPAWLAAGTTERGFPYQVQEFVKGEPLSMLDSATGELLLEVVERQAGLDPDPDRDLGEMAVAEVIRGPKRARLRDSGEAGQEVVAALDRLCGSSGRLRLPGGDMVHGDLGVENVMSEHGRVTGVIDIEALGSGSRVFDLAKLVLHGHVWESEPAALCRIHAHAEALAGADVLRVFLAANSYNLLDHGLTYWPSIDPVAAVIVRLAADLL